MMAETSNEHTKKSLVTKIMMGILILSLITNLFFMIQLNRRGDSSQQKYRLVNPLIDEKTDKDDQNPKAILHYTGLKQKIIADIEAFMNTTNVTNSDHKEVGLFVQDVHTGSWLGLNERDGFVPASLLKIPIMMAILKKADRDEIQLTDKIKMIETGPEYLDYLDNGKRGNDFMVWELMKEMILSSDNAAANALLRQLSPAEIHAVFIHVGIELQLVNTTLLVTPRTYIRLFKSLYYSTFLSPELSEKALDLTTDTQTEDLLSAGIPPEIQVAHKFGQTPSELHDCGIVYHPVNPYFICVMTRRIGYDKEKEVIALVSKDVFEFVERER